MTVIPKSVRSRLERPLTFQSFVKPICKLFIALEIIFGVRRVSNPWTKRQNLLRSKQSSTELAGLGLVNVLYKYKNLGILSKTIQKFVWMLKFALKNDLFLSRRFSKNHVPECMCGWVKRCKSCIRIVTVDT